MKDVMLDLETFGTGPNACIVQIGACYFNRNSGEIGKTFDLTIDAESSVKSGGVMDAGAVYFWLKQGQAARESICKPGVSLDSAMILLNSFLSDAEYIWSHATFDFPIIVNTFKRLGIKPAFSYKAARDIRTLTDLGKKYNKQLPRPGTHHTAIDDCYYQVHYCTAILAKLSEAINALK